jgi:hypothetical protein
LTVVWSAHLPHYLLHPHAAGLLQSLGDGGAHLEAFEGQPHTEPQHRGKPGGSFGREGTYTIGTHFKTPDDAAAAIDLLLLALQRPTSLAERLAPRVPLNHGLQAYTESDRRPRIGEPRVPEVVQP